MTWTKYQWLTYKKQTKTIVILYVGVYSDHHVDDDDDGDEDDDINCPSHFAYLPNS